MEGAVEHARKSNVNLLFDSSGESLARNKKFTEQFNNVGIFIGHGGGWEEDEVQIAREKKFEVVSSGKLTFRSETAVIIASYLVTNSNSWLQS